MKIHSLQKSDLQQVNYLQTKGWPDILNDFNHYLKMSFCFSVKAVVYWKLSGVSCGMRFRSSGWLAHIIVKPAKRRKGIWVSLIRYLLKILRKKRVKSISLIATEQGNTDLFEGPIIATTKASARALLALKFTFSNKVVLPGNNLVGIDCLEDIGFKKSTKKLQE